jgi:hypothetical protein
MKDGKVVRVEVKSEKGGRFRLVEPRQQAYNNKMPEGWVHGKTRNSGEAMLKRDFKPGEVVSLTMAGDCAATAGDPSRALELVGVFGGRRSSRFHMSVKTPPSRP